MVSALLLSFLCLSAFQYSLCRVVLMVRCRAHAKADSPAVSVLALSSRFDGPVSILLKILDSSLFQYSLCRVVLMVASHIESADKAEDVSVLALSSRFDGHMCCETKIKWHGVSVLALSSRFDGHNSMDNVSALDCVSVLALSSRFDGPFCRANFLPLPQQFQYSLCRVVLMVRYGFPPVPGAGPGFSTRSVESF